MMRHQRIIPSYWGLALALMQLRSQDKEEEKARETDKRPQRDEHKKDEALEEFVDPNPNEKADTGAGESDADEGMGRSEKAKRQASDERDRYKDDK